MRACCLCVAVSGWHCPCAAVAQAGGRESVCLSHNVCLAPSHPCQATTQERVEVVVKTFRRYNTPCMQMTTDVPAASGSYSEHANHIANTHFPGKVRYRESHLEWTQHVLVWQDCSSLVKALL
eukprot:2908390-Amphidinium_carterae.1